MGFHASSNPEAHRVALRKLAKGAPTACAPGGDAYSALFWGVRKGEAPSGDALTLTLLTGGDSYRKTVPQWARDMLQEELDNLPES